MKKAYRAVQRKLCERRASRYDRFMQDYMNLGDSRMAEQFAHRAQAQLLRAHELRMVS